MFSAPSLLALVAAALASTAHAAVLPRQSGSFPGYILEYAPLSYLYSGESWWPADIATHLQHVIPEDGTKKVASSVSFSTIGSLGSNIYLTSKDDPFDDPSWIYGNGAPQSNGATSAPATIIAVPKAGGIVDAFYFYFYSWDHAEFLDMEFGDHVGDWEHSMVRFVNGVPQYVYLSAHSGGGAYTFDAMQKQNGRPVTYIGVGTHANYATPGSHEHDFPGLDDYTDNGHLWDVTINFRGFWYGTGSNSFSMAMGTNVGGVEEFSGEGVGWLNFQGKWGDKQYSLFHDGQYCVGIPDVATECLLVDGPTGPIAKNLGRTAVCQDESDCTINSSLS